MKRITPLVQAFIDHGRVADCPVIDMHCHPDRFRDSYFPHPEPQGIIATMDRCGIRRAVVASHAGMVDPYSGSRATLSLLRNHLDRFLAYWGINPHYPEAFEEAQARTLDTVGVIGYKIHPMWHDCALTDARYQPILQWAHDHQLIVLVHTANDPRCNAQQCLIVAQRYPNMTLLLGHSCYDDYAGAIALAREHENIYLELTMVASVPGFIERAVGEAGSHKIVFGTDLPWFNPHFLLGCVLYSQITDDDRHAILHRNAERLLAEVAHHRLDAAPAR
jgi:predicted TIM-barrel fold metal-dependent hydrolase